MQPEEDITTLIKFSSWKYINDLQKGKIYMNTLGYFKNCESKIHQDDFEGIDVFHQAKDIISIKIESQNIKPINLTKETGLINFRSGRTSNNFINIFCMYLWMVNKHNIYKIDTRVLKFGEAALIITNANEFMRRIKRAIKRDNFIYQSQAVEYFDENTHHGDVGIFKKRKSFEYMNEYRIAVKAKMDNNPYILDIGDIFDISAAISSHEINNLKIDYHQKVS
ncbi:hypothetical protein [Aquicella lusitana]|uniref:Uncharacterized protein n=1 Tax=Aquicella lusitana TaxID=254246 RepID=A0A370GBR9_9COXI|nr:hypothetical protein [Aquicella lusitana]RDI41147.1 hypothetical protein C8D86_12147 [Aquicella lusitana]VVC74670.1 hypothetical protein AQULUS_24360 [Aquicella lusitana]